MEIHLHLAAAYPREPWVEHFDWLESAVQRAPGNPRRPDAGPGPPRLGVTLSEQARAWTTESVEFGNNPFDLSDSQLAIAR